MRWLFKSCCKVGAVEKATEEETQKEYCFTKKECDKSLCNTAFSASPKLKLINCYKTTFWYINPKSIYKTGQLNNFIFGKNNH